MVDAVLRAAVAVLVGLLDLQLVAYLLARWAGSRRKGSARGGVAQPRFLFLVSAHNEEVIITECVRSIMAVDYPATHFHTVVIANNCSDRTYELARAAGAETLERHDPVRAGKPDALKWGVERLPIRDFDLCVIIDADTLLDPGFANAVASAAPTPESVFQTYFGTLNESESWLTRLGALLGRCRYERAYPLKERAGLNCPLTGNGMCVGTGILAETGWPAVGLTENWELYARYTAEGKRIGYVGGARLYSQEARSLSGSTTQRRRWLAGRLATLRQWGPVILRSRRIGMHQKLDAICELAMPSPVLHLVAVVLLGTAAFALWPARLATLLALAAVASMTPLLLDTVVVIARSGEPWATVRALLMLPLYAAWRVGVAVVTLLTLRDVRWRKTEHHAGTGEQPSVNRPG